MDNLLEQYKKLKSQKDLLEKSLKKISNEILQNDKILMHSYLEIPVVDSECILDLYNKDPLNPFEFSKQQVFMIHIEVPGSRISISSGIQAKAIASEGKFSFFALPLDKDDVYIWCSPLELTQAIELNVAKEGEELTDFYGLSNSHIIKLNTSNAKDISVKDFVSLSYKTASKYINSYFSENEILNGELRIINDIKINLQVNLKDNVLDTLFSLSEEFKLDLGLTSIIKTKDSYESSDLESYGEIINQFEALYLSNSLDKSLIKKETKSRKNKV